MFKRGLFIVVSILVFLLNAKYSLAITTYEFTGAVNYVDPALSGFPTVLEGITAGNSLAGSFSYNGATSPSTNPFSGMVGTDYAPATYYSVPNTFSLTIKDVPIPIGGTTLSIFVWNNEPVLNDGWNDHDGFKINNSLNTGLPYYLSFGGTSLLSNTFSDTSLPTTSINTHTFGFEISGNTYNGRIVYLMGSVEPLIASNPVPVPPAIWLFGSGLIGLAGIGRKRFKK